MSKRSDLLKSVIKQNASEKPTFGTDPRDPWSTKANISEDAVLNTFLKSRGINPEHVTKNQKVAHSKMGEFLKWKRDHMFDKPVSEETDEKDMVCLDIPLLIRVLEFTREEMKTDIELHNMVERLINMRHDVPLDMSHYDEITQKLVKENHIAIAMGKMLDDESGMVLTQIEELERGCAMIRSYIGKDYEKQLPAWVQAKITLATDYMSTVGNYLVSKNENVKEEVKSLEEKNVPTSPEKWAKAKSAAKSKFAVYPSAYANGWASKKYKSMGGGWKAEEVEHIDESAEEITARHQYHHTQMIAAMKSGDKASEKHHSNELNKAKQDWAVHHANQPKKQPDAIAQDYANREKMYGPGKVRDSVEIESDVISELNVVPNTKFLSKVGSFVHNNKTSSKSKTSLSTMRDAFKNDQSKEPNKTVRSSDEPNNVIYRAVRAEEVVNEGSAALRLAQALRKEREARELKDKSREAAEKNEKTKQPTQQQENTMDSLAATGAPNDCANTPDDVAPKDKNKKLIQMSKSARIIKSIYNRKNMKEETFDTEKEDKSVATYGKKPKLTDNEKKLDATNGKSSAAAIMTGGTTLTGTPRDTVEIDPMMKLKPGLMGQSGQAIKPKNNNR